MEAGARRAGRGGPAHLEAGARIGPGRWPGLSGGSSGSGGAMRSIRTTALFVSVGMVTAACGTSLPAGMLEKLGEGEGELNLVIWAGYAEDGSAYPEFDWVTPFEEETGCIVNSTPMADSAAGMQFLRSGEYDGGSFSGNATDRLMAAGGVAPGEGGLVPHHP